MFQPKLFAVALLATLPLTATAQQKAAESQNLFPPGIVMHDTLLVGHLDLTQIDVQTTTQILSQLSGDSQEPTLSALAEGLLTTLRDAGAKDVYVSVPGRALLQGGLCVVILCEDRATVSKTLTGLLASASLPFEFRVLQTDNAVIACPAGIASDFQNALSGPPSAQRPEFDKAAKSMADFPHQIVISLPGDIHDELAKIWPEKLGNYDPTGVSPQRWADSVRSMAIGWSLPPEASLEIKIQSVDAAAATAGEQEISKLLKLIPPGMPRPQIDVHGDSVVIKTDPQELQTFFTPLMQPARQDAQRRQAMNQFKQLALAMHNFYSAYKFVPGKYTVDADGRPLLSWRVALLPYIDQAALYAKFKLDEPWDSEHNRPLAEQMPDAYRLPGDDLAAGKTRIRLPVLDGSLWSGTGPPRTFRDVTDGTSNTVWIAAAPKSAAVTWTKPDDWELDEAQLKQQFFGDQPHAIVSFADGSVHVLTPAIEAQTLKALLTIAGAEVVQHDEIK